MCPTRARTYGRAMTAPVLTRYPLDASAARRRRRRIAVVVAVRREAVERLGVPAVTPGATPVAGRRAEVVRGR
ncbi:hypothetical protein GCM10027519_31280 [Kineococcus endophyticus]